VLALQLTELVFEDGDAAQQFLTTRLKVTHHDPTEKGALGCYVCRRLGVAFNALLWQVKFRLWMFSLARPAQAN
jgi:hypothetical protein